MFGLKKKLDFGIIIGKQYDHFLSFDEYIEHLLLPFSPRFRNIDFAVSSLSSAGIKNIMVLTVKDKEIILDYLVKSWPLVNFYVYDYLDAKIQMELFFLEYIKENSLELFVIIKGSYPVWLDMNSFRDALEKSNNVAIKSRLIDEDIYSCLVVEKKIFLKKIEVLIAESGGLDLDIRQIAEENKMKTLQANGYLSPFKSIKEYYDTHMNMLDDYLLLDRFNASVPIKGDLAPNLSSRLEKGSFFKNSLFGENVEVHGTVENSLIFSNVKIEKDAVIKNSIIFPGNHIGHDAVIINSIIDEFSEDNTAPNIEHHASIGNDKTTAVNQNFPHIINFGVSLIGKDVIIPAQMKIGGNCYVESFASPSEIRDYKILPDGYTILRKKL